MQLQAQPLNESCGGSGYPASVLLRKVGQIWKKSAVWFEWSQGGEKLYLKHQFIGSLWLQAVIRSQLQKSGRNAPRQTSPSQFVGFGTQNTLPKQIWPYTSSASLKLWFPLVSTTVMCVLGFPICCLVQSSPRYKPLPYACTTASSFTAWNGCVTGGFYLFQPVWKRIKVLFANVLFFSVSRAELLKRTENPPNQIFFWISTLDLFPVLGRQDANAIREDHSTVLFFVSACCAHKLVTFFSRLTATEMKTQSVGHQDLKRKSLRELHEDFMILGKQLAPSSFGTKRQIPSLVPTACCWCWPVHSQARSRPEVSPLILAQLTVGSLGPFGLAVGHLSCGPTWTDPPPGSAVAHETAS